MGTGDDVDDDKGKLKQEIKKKKYGSAVVGLGILEGAKKEITQRLSRGGIKCGDQMRGNQRVEN